MSTSSEILIDIYLFFFCFFFSKNKKDTDLWIGVDARGIGVYDRDNRLLPKVAFPWSEIKNISFKDKRVCTAVDLSISFLGYNHTFRHCIVPLLNLSGDVVPKY